MMKRFLTELVDRFRGRAEARRKRALRRAVAEMERREAPDGGTIWKSGKGGSHIG